MREAMERVLAGRERLGARPDLLFFWGHRPRKDGRVSESCFSQWFPARFVVEGIGYAHAEQFMMAAKERCCGDDEAWQAVLASDDPARVKQIGREVRGFDAERWTVPSIEAVLQANLAKFEQNPELGAFLLSTGERTLVEASPADRVWGIGLARDDPRAADPRSWLGENRLGFALMEVRAALRQLEAS